MHLIKHLDHNMERKSQAQSATDFVLEVAELKSLYGETFDITDVVTDIDVYENLDKPFITGVVSFVDPDVLSILGSIART